MDEYKLFNQDAPGPLPELTEEEKSLWKRKSEGDAAAKNALVEKYYGIIEANTDNVIETIVAAIEESDFHQAAMVGYLSAVQDYDIESGMRFEDYSSLRVRQAIMEELANFIRE